MSTRDYRRRRKRTNPFTGIIVFILVAAVFVLLSTTVLFNVENIRVTGASNYTADEIIQASGIQAGDNIVRLNASKCCEKIESSLVYIENCEITRAFPDGLVINVEASVPAANFIDENTIMLVSSSGKILEMISEPKAGLLNFKGVSPAEGLIPGNRFTSADEMKNNAINQLMEYFDGKDTKVITEIDVSDRADVSYTYDGRITVRMGSVNDLEYKMNFSQKIITTKIGDKTEGILTLLSDSDGASFLDKESLENNAQVFSENMAAQTSESAAEGEETEETSSKPAENVPVME